jgi:hypothetical protein
MILPNPSQSPRSTSGSEAEPALTTGGSSASALNAWLQVLVTSTLCGGLLGCEEQPRAPLASDGSDPERTEDSMSADDLIAVTDEGAVSCGETSIELPVKRPNFYFVVDSSGSMREIMPATGGQTRHWAARVAMADMLRAVGHRVNFGAAAFPSPTDGAACADGSEVFAVRPGDRRAPDAGTNGPAIDALLFTLRKIRPEGATPTGRTLTALLPDLLELGPKTYVFLLTDGAPNCSPNDACEADRCIANIESYTLENGQECDETFNCCAADRFPYLCLDDVGTIESVERLREAGIATYVIGIPGSETYANVLDAVARRAGTAQVDAGTDYYRVDDVEQLAATLTDLGEELSLNCNLDLAVEPERPGLVKVFADGEVLAEDDENGWEWTSDTSLVLLGGACRRWKRGDWDEIRILEGCDVQVR